MIKISSYIYAVRRSFSPAGMPLQEVTVPTCYCNRDFICPKHRRGINAEGMPKKRRS